MIYRVWNSEYKPCYEEALKFMNKELAYKYYEYVVRKNTFHWKDSEKTKTYRAEWKFESQFPHVKKPLTLKECERFVNRVLKSKLWSDFDHGRCISTRQNRASKKVQVEEMRSKSLAGSCYGNLIRLDSTSGMNKYVVLHELAHAAGFSKHDHRFRATLLRLVSRFLGRAEAKALKKCFREAKLRVTPPTVKSPEAWLKACERAPIKIVA